MLQDDLIYSVGTFAVGAYLFYMWLADRKYFVANSKPRKGAFAGAVPCSAKIVWLGGVLALLLLATQVLAEYSFGFTSSQTEVGAFALFSWVAAAFVEELVFRGYLVVQNRGKAWLVVSILFFSLIFALAHPFFWDYKIADETQAGGWVWNFTAKAAFDTLCIFECSLLFYFMRFASFNPTRSLLPSVAAHFAFNIGVFAVKAMQGFVKWTF